MRRRLVLVAALAALVLPGAATRADSPLDLEPQCGTEGSGTATADPATPLRVASFNVLHGITTEGDQTLDARLPLAAQAIVGSGADIVGGQEVSVTNSHGHVAQKLAAAVAGLTDQAWHWCWFQSNPHFPGEPDLQPGGGGGPITEIMVANSPTGDGQFREGIAILSRFPITDAAARRVTPRSYEAAACVPPDAFECTLPAFFDSRSVLRARISTPAGALDAYTTHIAHHLTDLSPVQKRLQIEQVLAIIDETATPDATPDLLIGDFNTTEDDADRYPAITGRGWVDTFRDANPGVPGFTGDQQVITDTPDPTATERIDFVFARPGGCGLDVPDGESEVFADQPIPYGTNQWLWPSDHLAVVSTVACAPPA